MECTFVVGQKVVCVDGKLRHAIDAGVRLPIEGIVYTISMLRKAISGHIGVDLVECPHPSGYLGYYVDRFRPLVTTKTDISLFHKILEEARKEAKENV